MARLNTGTKHARLGSQVSKGSDVATARRGSQATTARRGSQTTTATQESSATVTQRDDHHQRDLTAACARGNEERVRRILTENQPWTEAKDKATLRKALQKASARHQLNIIRLLLHYGAEVDAGAHDEFPPLYRAAQAGQRAVVEELLKHRPDLEARETRTSQTPLFAASVRGFHNIAALLLAKGARVDAHDRDGRTPLLAMATNSKFKSMETVSILADHGANLEAKDQIGRTPLLWAATNWSYDFAKTLLEKGASVSAVNNRGRTALHLTVDSSNGRRGGSGEQAPAPTTPREEMLRLLLQHGADVNAVSDGGWKPLHNAAQKGLTSIVEILLRAGADINATLSNGMTALHWAAFNGFEDTAQLLWSQPEADLNIKDTFGRAAWLYAAERGHDDLVELLSPGHNSHRLPKSMQDASQAFNATVVEFKDYGEKQRISKPSVFDLLYKWDEKNGRPSIPLWTDGPPGHAKSEFKWIHLPANNLAWVETLMINWFIESGCRDLEGFKALMKSLEQEHCGPLPHANYMRPFCQRISSQHPGDDDGGGPPAAGEDTLSPWKGIRRSTSNLSQMTLSQGIPGGDGKIVMFMPYLHYETDESRQKMMDAIKIVSSASQASARDKTPDTLLLEAYLNHKPSLHPRRTLDQFFYRGIDTSARDRDQVVYRYCEDHGHERKVFMVDQLWVLVLNKDLIITCFPERFDLKKNQKDPLGVLDGIVAEMNAKTRPPVRSVYHMAILVSGRCSGMFSRHRADDQDYQFLDMFESSVGRVTEDLTHLFHHFEQASSQSRQWSRPSRRSKLRSGKNKKKNKPPTEESSSFDRLLDIGSETSLLTEVRDIRDELNILTMILNSQLWTLGDLKNCLVEELSLSAASSSRMMRNNVNSWHAADIRKRTLEQERHLKVHKRDIQSMDEQAERLYQSLTDLLDLKQKHSNALEARFASEQAISAARSGQTVMVFTIVTIIFLPMSFISAYFGVNIESFDKLDGSYVAIWTFGCGLAISAVFVIMAFTVVDITKALNRFGAFVRRITSRREDAGPDDKDESGGGADGGDHGYDYQEVAVAVQPPTPGLLQSPGFRQLGDQSGPLSRERTNNTMRSDDMEMGILKQTELDLVKTKTAISFLSKTRSAVSADSLRSRRRMYGEDDLEWGRRDRETTAETC
ncbi:ankyrin repeat protein [Apiospora kogelbergensis]|uniref:Ankyrin repeat protein n=1 Tax=Apiospora kogelbergensis TaxID=1337665 RepID=A0AAW0QMB0_9PEZI